MKLEIAIQGAPGVNHAIAHEGDLAMVHVDLQSKYCEVCSWGADDDVPVVMVCANGESLKLDPGQPADALTQISFPEYRGWQVASATAGRYTVTVVFKRDR